MRTRGPGVIGCAGPALCRLIRAGVLLMRSVRPQPQKGSCGRVRKEKRVLESGKEYDLYEPEGPAVKTCILIHGLTVRGPGDSRLVNFARALARSGIRVAAPSLEGLRSFRFNLQDPEVVKELVLALHEEYGGKVSIIGFSVGGGYALIAASGMETAGYIDPLILLGAHHSLSRVWEHLLTGYQTEPAPDDSEAWEGYLWMQMVLAYREMDSFQFSSEERAELFEQLRSYCDEPLLQRKCEFYERCLKSRSPALHQANTEAEEVLEALSPSGKLGRVEARVYLLHDPHDGLVPAGESARVWEELSLRRSGHVQELLITPLISHVKARFTWKIRHIYHLLRFFGEVFRIS